MLLPHGATWSQDSLSVTLGLCATLHLVVQLLSMRVGEVNTCCHEWNTSHTPGEIYSTQHSPAETTLL